MIKVVTFDVWDTLLKVNFMFEGISEELSELSGINLEIVKEAFDKAKNRAKELRYSGKLPAKEAVFICQSMVANILGVDVDYVRRATAKATIKMREDIIIPETLEVLKFVKGEGLKTACIGNVQFWSSNYTRIFLERFGISDYLDRHFFSDEVGIFKPNREIFTVVANFFRVKPNEMLHIGDKKKEDFEGAKQAGLKAILLKENTPLKQELVNLLA